LTQAVLPVPGPHSEFTHANPEPIHESQ